MKSLKIPAAFITFSALFFVINITNKLHFFGKSDIIELNENSHVLQKPLEEKKIWAMIIHGLYCNEIDNQFSKHWDVYIRMSDNLIVSCQTSEKFHSLEFIKKFITTGGERLAVFKNLPSDLSVWTNQYTLFIPNFRNSSGHVCKDRSYSLTMETGDITMKDWNIPFHIKNRKVRYSDAANFILEKETLWLLPLFEEEKTITPILNFLSLRSIIRAIDNKSLKRRKYLNGAKIRFNEDTTVLNFLKRLRKTITLNQVIEFIEKTNYNVSLNANPDFEKNRFCSSAKWKETGKLAVKDPDCHEIKMNVTLKGQVPMRDDVLLVIVYNRIHYENMPYVNSLYGKLFKYIAYCGPNTLPTKFNGFFITYPQIKGLQTGGFGHLCASMYLSMRHKHTNGLLVIADDMLLNVHRLDNLPTNKFWIVGRLLADIRYVRPLSGWRLWWKTKNSTTNLLEKLHTSNDIYLKNCAKVLKNMSFDNYTIVGGYSDIYYVPYTFIQKFLRLNEFFLENESPFEIALPTMFLCLKNTHYLKAYSSKRERNKQWKYIETFPNNFYLHPVKWGKMMAQKEDYPLWRNLYCRSKVYINDKSENPVILKFYRKE